MAPASTAPQPHDDDETPDAIRISWVTLPVALLDLAAAAIAVNHATAVADMEPVVWATVYILNLFLIWVYHVGHSTRSCSRFFFVVARVLYGGLLGFVLWDHSQPHEVYDNGQFVMTASSTWLVIAGLMTALGGAAMLYHFMVLGRIKRVVEDTVEVEPVEAEAEARAASPEGEGAAATKTEA